MQRFIILSLILHVALSIQASEVGSNKTIDENFNTFEIIKFFLEITVTIIVGVASIIIAWSANKLTKRQIKNEELLNKPFLEIKDNVFTFKNINDSESITISNNGSHLTNFEFETYTFLLLRNNGIKQVYYVSGFMDRSTIHNPHKGLLVDIKTLYSRDYFHTILKNTFDYNEKTNKHVLVDLERYIVIHYQDYKKEPHCEIYKTDGFYWTQVDKIKYDHNKSNLFKIKYLSEQTIENLLVRNV